MDEYQIKAGLAQVESFHVVGLSCVTSNKDGAATQDINALWERVFQEQIGQKIQGRADDVLYAVYSDYEGDHEAPYRITIGYRVSEDSLSSPEGFHHIAVRDGEYALMSAAGMQPKALLETWEAVWSSDLERAFQTDFEVYGPRFFEEGVHEILVHVGLKNE